MKLVFKDSVDDFLNFKDTVFELSPKRFSDLYERTSGAQELQGETDLNEACTEEILRRIQDKKVLEVGCGRGYLAKKLAKQNRVTACDIVIANKLGQNGKDKIRYVQANIESLPFKDNEFEVVVTTHTLEHVQNLTLAMAELRRVAKESLVIVVPKQRAYKYTFNLHTQFFPYKWSLQNAFNSGKRDCTIIDLGDWFYEEQKPVPDSR